MGAAPKPCDHAQHLRQHHDSSVFDTHWYPGPRDVHICSPIGDHVAKRMPYKGKQRAENWIQVRKWTWKKCGIKKQLKEIRSTRRNTYTKLSRCTITHFQLVKLLQHSLLLRLQRSNIYGRKHTMWLQFARQPGAKSMVRDWHPRACNGQGANSREHEHCSLSSNMIAIRRRDAAGEGRTGKLECGTSQVERV